MLDDSIRQTSTSDRAMLTPSACVHQAVGRTKKRPGRAQPPPHRLPALPPVTGSLTVTQPSPAITLGSSATPRCSPVGTSSAAHLGSAPPAPGAARPGPRRPAPARAPARVRGGAGRHGPARLHPGGGWGPLTHPPSLLPRLRPPPYFMGTPSLPGGLLVYVRDMFGVLYRLLPLCGIDSYVHLYGRVLPFISAEGTCSDCGGAHLAPDGRPGGVMGGWI